MKTISLTPKSEHRIILDSYSPKFQVNDVVVEGDIGEDEIICFSLEKRYDSKSFKLRLDHLQKSLSELNSFLDGIADLLSYEITVSSEASEMVSLLYESRNLFVPIESELERFRDHLENPINKQVLFSAPFGQGKTTFLNSFFSEREEDYVTYYVSPVHYSIATNEDIFKYIKCEILLQLLEKGIVPDCASLKGFDLLKFYIEQNPHKILGQLIKSGAKVRRESNVIYEGIESMINSFKNYKSSFDKESLISHYFNKEEEKEGSLFEDDFYTQMIRSGLTKLGSDNERKSVLIIDDLDRLDPEHIFRILNILSVHSEEAYLNEGDSNKFGFEKIILVCDLNNIRSIFHHKYGTNTHFEGYINKFYSTKPFYFRLEAAICNELEILKKSIKSKEVKGKYDFLLPILSLVITDLILNNVFTLRELIKFTSIDYEKEIDMEIRNRQLDSRFSHSLIFHLSLLLSRIENIENRIRMLTNYTRHKNVSLRMDYFLSLSFVSISEKNKDNYFSYKLKDGTELLFENDGIGYNGFLTYLPKDNKELEYSPSLFYELLLENIIQTSKLML